MTIRFFFIVLTAGLLGAYGAVFPLVERPARAFELPHLHDASGEFSGPLNNVNG